jgi:hypothetical protein
MTENEKILRRAEHMAVALRVGLLALLLLPPAVAAVLWLVLR